MKNARAPENLDLEGLALTAKPLGGTESLAGFDRLVAEVDGEGASALLTWQAAAQWRVDASGAQQVWLHLTIRVSMAQTCQRCLGVVDVPLAVDGWFRFVQTEEQALLQDEQAHEDVLVFAKPFDLRELIADEVLLALPLVACHEVCPVEPKLSVRDDDFIDEQEPRANPFAALAQLQTAKKPGV